MLFFVKTLLEEVSITPALLIGSTITGEKKEMHIIKDNAGVSMYWLDHNVQKNPKDRLLVHEFARVEASNYQG